MKEVTWNSSPTIGLRRAQGRFEGNVGVGDGDFWGHDLGEDVDVLFYVIVHRIHHTPE